jgi:biopolymer transport protein TolR
MGASTRGGRRRRGFADINVTPLVDVMLVLLIVFMVTAPLLATGLRIELPSVQAANTPIKDAKLIVSITKEERIVFGEADCTANIETVLRTNARVMREKELYIRADEQAHYGVVARVVAAARSAGVVSLNLLVNPEEPRR